VNVHSSEFKMAKECIQPANSKLAVGNKSPG
jgi:hypothetical protein